ncbi:MAG: crossover junction endodeoxyribonuclease RuvC [Bacteroidales bacterium]
MSVTKSGKIILGIDPGTTVMGYGIVHAFGKTPVLVTLGIIELSKIPDHYLKLKKIYQRVTWLIDKFHPDEMAIEAPFYGKNIQSMLKLGRAQGAAIAAALSRDMPIFEYAPRKIKQSITGKGNASKEQVAGILCSYLKMKSAPRELDATDGLAAAVCHFFQANSPFSGREDGYKGWEDFIRKNPHRLK